MVEIVAVLCQSTASQQLELQKETPTMDTMSALVCACINPHVVSCDHTYIYIYMKNYEDIAAGHNLGNLSIADCPVPMGIPPLELKFYHGNTGVVQI